MVLRQIKRTGIERMKRMHAQKEVKHLDSCSPTPQGHPSFLFYTQGQSRNLCVNAAAAELLLELRTNT